MADAFERQGPTESGRILDVGCGSGDTLARIAQTACRPREQGRRCVGIDKSEELIRLGRAKYPGLDLRVGDAVDLNEAEIGGFDVVVAECVLSVSGAPEAALREAANATAPGGRLFIADLCGREEAARLGKPRPEPDPAAPALLTRDGYLPVGALTSALRGRGFTLVTLEDRTHDLDSFAAEKIFEHGSLEAYRESAAPQGCDPGGFFPCAANGKEPPARAPGYFLAVFRKEDER
jgi:SAM-dependent methyltransferase